MAVAHGVLGTDVQVAAKLSPMFTVMGARWDHVTRAEILNHC